jgi:hypothetical protein
VNDRAARRETLRRQSQFSDLVETNLAPKSRWRPVMKMPHQPSGRVVASNQSGGFDKAIALRRGVRGHKSFK